MSHPDRDTIARVTDVIRDRLSVVVPTADTDLIASGLLDSLALVMLITALEEAFACELPLDDFNLERFRSVERITEFLSFAKVLDVRESQI